MTGMSLIILLSTDSRPWLRRDRRARPNEVRVLALPYPLGAREARDRVRLELRPVPGADLDHDVVLILNRDPVVRVGLPTAARARRGAGLNRQDGSLRGLEVRAHVAAVAHVQVAGQEHVDAALLHLVE